MTIEMFLKVLSVMLFAVLTIAVNIKAGETWLKLFTMFLFVISILYAGYLIII